MYSATYEYFLFEIILSGTTIPIVPPFFTRFTHCSIKTTWGATDSLILSVFVADPSFVFLYLYAKSNFERVFVVPAWIFTPNGGLVNTTSYWEAPSPNTTSSQTRLSEHWIVFVDCPIHARCILDNRARYPSLSTPYKLALGSSAFCLFQYFTVATRKPPAPHAGSIIRLLGLGATIFTSASAAFWGVKNCPDWPFIASPIKIS